MPNGQQEFQPQYLSKSQPFSSNSGITLEDIFKMLTSNIVQFQQETRPNIQNLKNLVSQLAIVVNRLEAKVDGRLPLQLEVNLKDVNAMTLRRSKEIEQPEVVVPKDKIEDRIEKEIKEEGRSNVEP